MWKRKIENWSILLKNMWNVLIQSKWNTMNNKGFCFGCKSTTQIYILFVQNLINISNKGIQSYRQHIMSQRETEVILCNVKNWRIDIILDYWIWRGLVLVSINSTQKFETRMFSVWKIIKCWTWSELFQMEQAMQNFVNCICW